MNRNTIILLVVLAAVGVGGFVWWRRRQQAAAMVTGYSAITPQPQANLTALQAPGAPFGLTGTAGQVANVVAGLLPPIGGGTSAPFMPQNTAKPPQPVAATAAGIDCSDPMFAGRSECASNRFGSAFALAKKLGIG